MHQTVVLCGRLTYYLLKQFALFTVETIHVNIDFGDRLCLYIETDWLAQFMVNASDLCPNGCRFDTCLTHSHTMTPFDTSRKEAF